MLQHSHSIIEEKAQVLHQVHDSIVRNTEAQTKISEMKQIGKEEAKGEYDRLLSIQKDESKKLLDRVRESYENIITKQ